MKDYKCGVPILLNKRLQHKETLCKNIRWTDNTGIFPIYASEDPDVEHIYEDLTQQTWEKDENL